MPETKKYTCRHVCSRPEYRDMIIDSMKRELLDNIKNEILDGNMHAIRFEQYENWSNHNFVEERFIYMDLYIVPVMTNYEYPITRHEELDGTMNYYQKPTDGQKPIDKQKLKTKVIVIDVEADIL